MGGKGVGHKSVRALLSRQVNIQKARAARRRPPLPWRSGMESRVIEQLVWQWYQSSGEWRVASGGKRQKPGAQAWGTRKNEKGKAASSSGGDRTGIREADRRSPKGQVGTPQIIARVQNKPWSAVRVARLLGVSHTWVNKLVKRFEADPERMKRKMRAFAPANLDTLERAREETRWEREMGRLRGPIRWRRVKVKIQGREMRMGVPTKEEMRRREKLKAVTSGEWRVASKQLQNQSPMRVAYGEAPSWARGLVLTGDTGSMITRGAGVRMPPIKTGTPRPVPFAFRRRR